MNLVDSSGWLEYFADGENADFFASAIEDVDHLIVSSINIYEVFKRILSQRDEHSALQAVAIMEQGQVIDLTSEIALSAAQISIENKIPMADSIIYATSKANKALLWTQDVDFQGLENVKYLQKKG
jgi:toxin FitB